jgi:hypothetical protein
MYFLCGSGISIRISKKDGMNLNFRTFMFYSTYACLCLRMIVHYFISFLHSKMCWIHQKIASGSG